MTAQTTNYAVHDAMPQMQRSFVGFHPRTADRNATKLQVFQRNRIQRRMGAIAAIQFSQKLDM